LMTGSRSCVFASILFVVIYIFIKVLQTSKIINFINLVKKLIIPLIVVTIAVSIWFQPAIETFSKRTTGDIAEKEFPNLKVTAISNHISYILAPSSHPPQSLRCGGKKRINF
ncbi:MAG: hypothetical protein ACKPGB_00185, partial [Dolichospermum sp.]